MKGGEVSLVPCTHTHTRVCECTHQYTRVLLAKQKLVKIGSARQPVICWCSAATTMGVQNLVMYMYSGGTVRQTLSLAIVTTSE